VHLLCALEQRVIDVGDVLDEGDLVPGVAPGAVEQVEADVRRRVAKVGGVVGRDAADVEARGSVRLGLDDSARGGVEEADRRTLTGSSATSGADQVRMSEA